MRSINLPGVILIVFAGCCIAFGQAAAVSPVPVWPANGIIPDAMTGRYVFYDPASEELVITYPENLGYPEYANNPGERKIYRVRTNRGTRPAIEFSVEEVNGRYRYTYRIENGENARQSINAWDLPAPSIGPEDVIEAPEHWRGSSMPSNIPAVGEALGAATSGVLIGWFFADDAGPVAPGEALAGFHILSSNKPGVSIGWVRGGLFPSFPEELPPEVVQQLAPARGMHFNTQGVVTIGPKFSAGESRFRIASDFHYSIHRLIADGRLDGSSPAIVEALRMLLNYMEQVETFRDAPIVLTVEPAPGFEAAFIGALELSLQ